MVAVALVGCLPAGRRREKRRLSVGCVHFSHATSRHNRFARPNRNLPTQPVTVHILKQVLYIKVKVENRRGKKKAVDRVQHAPQARQRPA